MRLSYRMLFVFLPLIACFMLQCQKTQDPEKNPKLSIKDVWISDVLDADGDGYVSHYRLNFDLDVSDGSMNVFIWLGVQIHDEADTALTYLPYFESANFSVEGSGEGDAKSIAIGLPNAELPQGGYDFLFIVFDGSDEDRRLAEQSEADNDDLWDIPIETATTDIGVSIWEAAFDDFIDQDGDGYASQATLWVDADETSGNGAEVRLFVYNKTSGSGSYDLYGWTDPFIVTGDVSDDEVGLDLDGFNHGTYDFMVELVFNNSLYLEDVKEAATWPDLAGIALELPAEDQTQFVLTFNNFAYTDIQVSVSGYGEKTAAVGGSAVFTLPGNTSSFTYTAQTAGYATGGTRIGELVGWGDTKNVSGSSATYNLNVSSTLFFLRMQNSGTVSLNPLYVNYGLSAQTMDNISIPNNSVLYKIGYYQAFTNTQIRAYWTGTTSYTYWDQGIHFTFPFTSNQILTLENTFKTKSNVRVAGEAPVQISSAPELPFAETTVVSSNQNFEEGETEWGYASQPE